jgi:hypothetical protein
MAAVPVTLLRVSVRGVPIGVGPFLLRIRIRAASPVSYGDASAYEGNSNRYRQDEERQGKAESFRLHHSSLYPWFPTTPNTRQQLTKHLIENSRPIFLFDS